MLAVEEEEVVVVPEEWVWLESRSECWVLLPRPRGAERVCCAACLCGRRPRWELLVWRARGQRRSVILLSRGRRRAVKRNGRWLWSNTRQGLVGSLSGHPDLTCWSPPSPPPQETAAAPLYCPDRIAAGGFSASPGNGWPHLSPFGVSLRRTLCLWQWAHT